ncbi:hypothetical protein L9G74_10565 [Shewanella sp. C32]|uniref:Uncharacterized protein n=1 Tax=Shewanella electrica TaxID=515560 RepID=A0ABT2FKM0_9GAMM|nr:hypothetical protein [Shewanella electrica]MCH1924665.1 hypothetical protein [Shewanella electrica]MCS4556887.1 hypothetical protein [Shewanella electrica]
MNLIWLEDDLAIWPDAPQSELGKQLQDGKFGHCVWLTDDADPLAASVVGQCAVVLFPAITALNDDAVAPVAEVVAAITLPTDKSPILIASPSHNLLGVWLAYHLMQQGAAPVHAVARVRATCEQCFIEDGWDQFVYDVLYQLQA